MYTAGQCIQIKMTLNTDELDWNPYFSSLTFTMNAVISGDYYSRACSHAITINLMYCVESFWLETMRTGGVVDVS